MTISCICAGQFIMETDGYSCWRTELTELIATRPWPDVRGLNRPWQDQTHITPETKRTAGKHQVNRYQKLWWRQIIKHRKVVQKLLTTTKYSHRNTFQEWKQQLFKTTTHVKRTTNRNKVYTTLPQVNHNHASKSVFLFRSSRMK